MAEKRKQKSKFRFQDLEIWQIAIEVADKLFDIADELEKKRLYRFAEQLRGAGMSMSNNIAEGSGSNSDKEFCHYLNIAHRSTFENANILIPSENTDNSSMSSSLDEISKLFSSCGLKSRITRSKPITSSFV